MLGRPAVAGERPARWRHLSVPFAPRLADVGEPASVRRRRGEDGVRRRRHPLPVAAALRPVPECAGAHHPRAADPRRALQHHQVGGGEWRTANAKPFGFQNV